MKVSDFDYELPEELIAQTPIEKRDMSRLMVVDRNLGKIEHKIFSDVIDYLNEGDCLVINNTKVIITSGITKLSKKSKLTYLTDIYSSNINEIKIKKIIK